MTMKPAALLSIVLALSALSGTALAEDKACMLEGSFTIGADKTEIKDCIQNNGVPKAQFTETCTSLAQATTAMGGPAAKVTYMPACPKPAQGTCVGFFGQPMSSHYYKRDAKLLASSKSGCLAQGGKWQ
jgi:hypothetical protein